MNLDQTQQQTVGDARRSERLSLPSSAPPIISGYHVTRPLGEGAFGQVWLANDLNTRRPVAIKVYFQHSSLNLESLGREVSLLVNMAAGRHIVQVLKVGWDHDPPFFVMEYLENGSLEDLIRSKEPISIGQCVTFLREIAEGLSFAHGKGVLHCDLKPANVLLDHGFQPRLADFGQGRMTGDRTASLGTLFYMAPEQADLQAAPDVTWDVYALGAIGYTLLTGEPPYKDPEILETLDTSGSLQDRLQKYRQTIISSSRPKLHYRRRGIDKPLAQIIDRCLQVDPQQRFQNVQQVIGALDHRQRVRNRRPFYILGLMGPLLLLTLALLFSARSRQLALEQSEKSVVQRALESNRFAARYAARTLESELEVLFRIVEMETQQIELKQLLRQCSDAASEELQKLASGDTDPRLTARIQSLPERHKLESYLTERLGWMMTIHSDTNALLNSMFINEASGTNLGISFTDASEQQSAVSPVGQNFAFRSYFTGLRHDAPSDSAPKLHRPTRSTRLSASFRSTSTGAWKIGISAPVWPEDVQTLDWEPIDGWVKPLGVLVLTINLGDFELLAEKDQANGQTQRFAALFDGRQGNQRGTLLQHPYIRQLEQQRATSARIPQIPGKVVDALIESGLDQYTDPAADFDGGEQFGGFWIASSAQVELPRSSSDRGDEREMSDLWILVQERRNSVSAPIQSLAGRLLRESFIQVAALLSVIFGMWYFVFRLAQAAVQRSRFRPNSSGEFPSEATETARL
jgi:eukaryotic-like serine/threonine-protein kinase